MSDTIDRPPSAPGPADDRDAAAPRHDAAFRDDRLPPRPTNEWLRLALVLAVVVIGGKLAGLGVLAIIGALLVSIFLHELGHYVVAKWAGMKVTEFFIGFGPRIWSFQRGETEYGLKLIPAGAYVRIIGMSNLEEVDPADEPRTYRAQPYWKRLPVVLAGPFANFLIAFVLLIAVFVGYGQTDRHSTDWTVDRVVAGSAAAQAGVEPGDHIVSVGGQPVGEWASLADAVQPTAGTPVAIVVDRDGQEVILDATLGWRLTSEAAASLPPLRAGDQITKVGDDEVQTFGDAYDQIESLTHRGVGQVTVEFVRPAADGSFYSYRTTITPTTDLPSDGATGFLGVGPHFPVEHFSVPGAVAESGSAFGGLVGNAVTGIGHFFSPEGLSRYADLVASSPPTGQDAQSSSGIEPLTSGAPATQSVDASQADQNRVTSIVGVVRLGSQAADTGWVDFVFLVIIVNTFLGLINLVPLPPLDGGHAAVATYEAIRGRISGRRYRIDMAKLLPVTYAMVFLLVGLGLTSIYLDIVNPAPNPYGP